MEWMNGKELLETIKTQCGLVAGMGMNEAAKSLGYSAMANGALIKPVVNTTATQIIQFPAATAAEAYAVGGAAATGAATSTAANLTLVNTTAGATAAGSSSVAGVLSVAAPIALSALAAVGGFLIGNELYEHNQEFFDDLTGPLMEHLADGTVNMMGLFDKQGNTYLSKVAYDAVLERFNNIPKRVETNLNISSEDIYTMTPKCSILSSGIYVTNWLFDNGYKLYQSYVNFNKDFYIEAVSQSLQKIESMFPNKLIAIKIRQMAYNANYPDSMVSNAMIDAAVFDTFDDNSISIHTEIDSEGITRHYMYCSGSATYVQIIGYYEPNKYGTLFYEQKFSENDSLYYGVATNNSLKFNGNQKIYLEPNGREAIATNFSYTEEIDLPVGVKKYNPTIAKVDPIYLIRGWNADGSPIEVPYIPVRLPSNPSETPIPNEEDDPSGDPEKNPNIVTPYIPTEVPYPSGTPIVAPKPAPTPEENPDNLPYQLPNPIPDTNPEPAVEPNPEVDPSISPEPTVKPNQIPVNDPVTNPENNGTTPSLDIPTVPTISSSATGLLHVYNPTNTQINEFGSWLWTTFSGDLIDTISKLFNNPMDGVIGVHELYATPSTASETTIKCGFLDSGVTSRLVNKRYTEINCGSIIVPEHWGNYLDYAPYTKAHCYLPFIGMVELNADDIIGHAVNITYKIDAYTGACIAVITVASSGYESICYQFPGNCAVEVPITSGMKSVLQSALLGAATTAIGAAVGGAAGAKIGGAAGAKIASTAATRGGAGAISGAAYGANAKNDVQHSGSFGSSFGAMGCKKPFLVIKRPKQKVVPGYNKNYGYPAHKMVTIGECSGYLRAREVDVVSVTATEDEKRLIEEALKSGVFVS